MLLFAHAPLISILPSTSIIHRHRRRDTEQLTAAGDETAISCATDATSLSSNELHLNFNVVMGVRGLLSLHFFLLALAYKNKQTEALLLGDI